jgi:hypothetical protein
MSSQSCTAPDAAEPAVDPMRELVKFVSGEDRPAGGAWGAASRQDTALKTNDPKDALTSELIDSLKVVVAALDSPEMATFFARAYAQGNTYTGPTIDMDRLRSLIAKAAARPTFGRRARSCEVESRAIGPNI